MRCRSSRRRHRRRRTPARAPTAGSASGCDDGVGDHDRRHGERVEHRNHVDAVSPAVDPVLMLHDGDVVVVESVGCGGDTTDQGCRRVTRRPAGPLSPAGPDPTTSTVPPLATRPADSAAENVAMPHAVGGKVDRMPNARVGTSSRWGQNAGDGGARHLLTSARSRRLAQKVADVPGPRLEQRISSWFRLPAGPPAHRRWGSASHDDPQRPDPIPQLRRQGLVIASTRGQEVSRGRVIVEAATAVPQPGPPGRRAGRDVDIPVGSRDRRSVLAADARQLTADPLRTPARDTAGAARRRSAAGHSVRKNHRGLAEAQVGRGQALTERRIGGLTAGESQSLRLMATVPSFGSGPRGRSPSPARGVSNPVPDLVSINGLRSVTSWRSARILGDVPIRNADPIAFRAGGPVAGQGPHVVPGAKAGWWPVPGLGTGRAAGLLGSPRPVW